LRLNRHGNTGTVHCIQENGAIYDTDQQSAEMRRREREEPQSKMLFQPEKVNAGIHVIVWAIRLPYALMALLVGMALGLAGAEMQT
ncbi:iron chelate uptake ABC transporter family permease subunit, partial [Salmonella enterica subsp. enterica serovar Cerro]|nr:iron chelate uptake ABC transporter family permease subunit [Salmonella enterica subsp. enterica serovar Cerro]